MCPSFAQLLMTMSLAYIPGCIESSPHQVVASWYDEPQETATGEQFDPNDFTAADWNVPLNSYILVSRPEIGRIVVVRINDRGPAKRLKRGLDLSRAAAKQLQYTEAGLSPVIVEPIK